VKTAAASTGCTGSSAGAALSPSVTTCSPRVDRQEAERAWQSWLDRLFA
jgi:hypothetical protein